MGRKIRNAGRRKEEIKERRRKGRKDKERNKMEKIKEIRSD